jgi:hypothetical protein
MRDLDVDYARYAFKFYASAYPELNLADGIKDFLKKNDEEVQSL